MSPSLTGSDERDGHFADLECGGDMLLLHGSQEKLLDFPNIAFGKLGVPIPGSLVWEFFNSALVFMMAAVFDRVLDVVKLSPLPKMSRIKACGVIARVQDEQVSEDAPIVEFERQSWHSPILSFKSNHAVSVLSLFVRPIQAFVRLMVLSSTKKKLPLLVRYSAFIHAV